MIQLTSQGVIFSYLNLSDGNYLILLIKYYYSIKQFSYEHRKVDDLHH